MLKVYDDHVFCLKDHILIAGFEEGGVVFNVENRASHVVNETALEILKLMDGKRSLKEIILTMARRWDQREWVIKLDAVLFLENLIERDWVYVE